MRLGSLFLAVALTAAGLLCPDRHAVISLPLAYVCVWAAIRLPLWKVAARDDLFYGTYIYSTPVQQLLLIYGLHRHCATRCWPRAAGRPSAGRRRADRRR
ncbi:hypothetical protein [Candidatus Frankia alpina]|uniref:hypothetical protein n=1 Tax=Candidatus Frankia alpina TaxID=2699483 RepID=UPI0013D57113|nr:hypothetical protein [Candidatus Frankia alpina]